MTSDLLAIVLFSAVLARVNPEDRTFVSKVVDKFIDDIKPNFQDKELAELFESCYPNTLDTTVYSYTPSSTGDADTFLITGDITAMWLRDSTNQVLFLLPLSSRRLSRICGSLVRTSICSP